ncbi:hypothetical protein CROQUDRAFT_674966 [Cronartium quercuum f. sp. fusiforme G11]|uniref:CMP/dCMP-type deaminase domain-containing protein n=1 Tax=Cronartium quercuum f. sp. fusiforme G11 TaxID=708437 RepID=A0A9P6N5M3_9BASI|nr:hypothetical protein CROQUDRAFT_674966 [Cronartium quercuum f. sp. fusiforme G11]
MQMASSINVLSPVHWLQLALNHARRSIPTPTAFCVGCVIVAGDQLVSTGFSRELPGNTHAEQCALIKLKQRPLPEIKLALYSTMEPCSVRLSGQVPCTATILDFNQSHPHCRIETVYVGVGEPVDFVKCEGTSKLLANGVRVIKVDGFEEECLDVARRKA